jgi:mannose-6-phosphate isomerase-like protein (cupin superfamily)
MPKPGDVLEAEGIKLRIVSLDPELLEMEADYAGTGALPPPHHHPSQDEHFEVLEGRVRAIIAGREQSFAQGESFDIPAGTTHQMGGDGPARISWQVRPALRTAEFFERAYSGRRDENFLEEFKNEFVLDT